VREQVRVLHAKAAEDHVALVGLAVAVCVRKKHNVRTMLDVDAVFVRQDAKRDREAFGENARLVDLPPPYVGGYIPHEDFVFRDAGIKGLRDFGSFIRVNRIFEGGHGPHAPVNVPIDRDEFSDAIGFRSDQFNFKSRRKCERRALLLWRERLRVRGFRRLRSADELCCGNSYGEYERQ
jgi:hypothetical protein